MLAANRFLLPALLFLLMQGTAVAQQKKAAGRCATVEVLQNAFKKNPSLKTKFERNEAELRQIAARRSQQPSGLKENEDPVYIPVVFHVVLQNPNLVTDAQIQAQLDTLNIDYAGRNADSTKIPSYFKPLFAKSRIQFKIARRTPNDEPSSGITRRVANKPSFAWDDPSVKYTAQGGTDAWDPSRYLNIWLTNISGGILGYATFPGGSVTAEQGVVVLYSSLPGGTATRYNKGRTLVHEVGHYLSLYHIWGDDDGCAQSDQVDDTPNQSTETGGCPSGLIADACAPANTGKMYQNYMDYTDDACMVMFTKKQDDRMDDALTRFRATLLTSNGADPIILFAINASLRSINAPGTRICDPNFTPAITLRNLGSQTLTSANIYASIDGGTPVLTTWTGTLASLASTNITLTGLTTPAGKHTLKIYVTDPNGTADGERTNDTLTTTLEYYPPVEPPLTESFEGNTFPPPGWDILNPDGYLTWEKITGVAKTGNASVVMRNLEYEENGPKDYLRLPQVNLGAADSAFLTFQVAAAVQSEPNASGNVWDTLQVLVSTDCGKTYTSIYKKWGSNLITRKTKVETPFVPTASEWRKDSVNLTGYIGGGPIMVAFLNSSEWENNIYLDDINLYKVVINPNLRERGYLVLPNPTTGAFSVQFYPNPVRLLGIAVFDAAGRRVINRHIGGGSTIARYDFDLSPFANGMYTVRIVFSDRTIVQKIFKNK